MGKERETDGLKEHVLQLERAKQVATSTMRHSTTVVFLLAAITGALRADTHRPHGSTRVASHHATTPAPGSAERKAIMDALRVRTLQMMGGAVPGAGSNQIIFVVSHLKVDRGWAFATVDPRSADGKWRGDTFSELLHKANGRWAAIESPAMEAADETFSEVKAISKLRAKYPKAPHDIF